MIELLLVVGLAYVASSVVRSHRRDALHRQATEKLLDMGREGADVVREILLKSGETIRAEAVRYGTAIVVTITGAATTTVLGLGIAYQEELAPVAAQAIGGLLGVRGTEAPDVGTAQAAPGGRGGPRRGRPIGRSPVAGSPLSRAIATAIESVGACGTANAGIDYAQDWGNATGTSSAAVLDGSTMAVYQGSHTGFSVWPTADSIDTNECLPDNMLRIDMDFITSGTRSIAFGSAITDSILTRPAVGDSASYRIYARFAGGDCTTGVILNTNHGDQTNTGTIGQLLQFACDNGPGFDSISFGIGSSNSPLNGYTHTTFIPNGDPVMLEWIWKRTDVNDATLRNVRVSDAVTGEVLKTDDHFTRSHGTPLALSGDNPTITIGGGVDLFWENYSWGGSDSGGSGEINKWFGAFAHCINCGWIGQHVPGEGS